MSRPETNNQKWLQQMRDGKLKIGCNLNLAAPITAELMARMGYDWVMVDAQHSGVNRESLISLFQAIKLGGAKSFIRVEGADDRAGIQQAMDCGADGILVPYVNTADDVIKAVSCAKYPTTGTRSIYVNLRPTFPHGAGIGGLMTYFKDANWTGMVAVQIETKSSIDNIEAITQVPGLDIAFIGPGDLCASMGLLEKYGPGAFSQPEFGAAVGSMVTNCQKNGVIPGFWNTSPDMVKLGFRFLAAGADIELMRSAAETQVKQLAQDLNWTPKAAPIDPSEV